MAQKADPPPSLSLLHPFHEISSRKRGPAPQRSSARWETIKIEALEKQLLEKQSRIEDLEAQLKAAGI